MGYRGVGALGELVYILPQAQGEKGIDLIHKHANIHTYIHTHNIQGYRGHTTTNLRSAIAVTVLRTFKIPPVKVQAVGVHLVTSQAP